MKEARRLEKEAVDRQGVAAHVEREGAEGEGSARVLDWEKRCSSVAKNDVGVDVRGRRNAVNPVIWIAPVWIGRPATAGPGVGGGQGRGSGKQGGQGRGGDAQVTRATMAIGTIVDHVAVLSGDAGI